MKQRIIVTSEQLRDRAVATCGMIPTDKPHIVDIREHKETRTDKQHRYYRHLVGVIAAYTGDDRESQHLYYKRRFLIDIFRDNSPSYNELVTRILSSPGVDENKMLDEIAENTSTKKAKVKMMNEYIERVHQHAASLGVMFPVFGQYQ